MKKIFITVFITGLLIGCNSQNSNEKNAVPGKNEEHLEHTTGLTLNNGAKWKADSITKANVVLLKTILTTAKKDHLNNYQQVAGQLQDGLNKMITECKMQGPDHEALHKWLEPLLEKTQALKNETTIERADKVFNEIEEHINLFQQYFD